ncbi:hypothetical protein, partial [Sandarakinorhabdus oryzae]|uniref:hypothetical protein n=1 Tax=Sandarakinorhabdus oryzae TaxID=2675220 RepID=UPI0018CC0B9B
ACLAAAYADRRAVLRAAAAPALRPLRCDGVWRGRMLMASAGPAIMIRDGDLVLAVATPPASAWTPWLSWRQAGRRLILQPKAGPAIRCRLT